MDWVYKEFKKKKKRDKIRNEGRKKKKVRRVGKRKSSEKARRKKINK